ncbi:Gp19/Gp15/Gp42 family protein [Amycolatopsis sp.]|uniref:Gp19/Gp15/Gp42 family protein n=1 Tax=Amycolatopsis sp. TaxID=37632 RepID=UPI002CCF5F12|nr:Gp19/Gp15/Gp42 family protein [Amycolatopsis sp.]HVV11581.1 Gp19/Gp15/Gp42 family protein [Amycolatopsis sp.]
MAYATAQDVANRFIRPLDTDEQRVVTTRLDDAERMLRRRVPDLADQIAAGTIDQGDVVMIEADMVLRLIRNPDGYKTETDGNYSYTISAEVASGRLQVLADEWALLGVSGGAFVIAPQFELPWAPSTGAVTTELWP